MASKKYILTEELKQAILQYIAGSKSQFTFAEVQQLFMAIQQVEEAPTDGNIMPPVE